MIDRTKLRKLLAHHFSRNELDLLCFDMGFDTRDLDNHNAPFDNVVISLIQYCERRSLLNKLVEVCQERRPTAPWPTALGNVEADRPSLKQGGGEKPAGGVKIKSTGDHNIIFGGGEGHTANVTHIHQAPAEDAHSLFQSGQALTQKKAYDQALEPLKKVIQLEPDNSQAYYYLALALLKGNRPKLLKSSTIQTIEQHLNSARHCSAPFVMATLLLAVVKYDYYVLNSLRETSPTVSQLLEPKFSLSKTEVNELLSHFEAPRNKVWESLKGL